MPPDPWRYCCPDCKRMSRFRRRVTGGYYCGDCNKRFPGRYDKKTGKIVRSDGSIVTDWNR